MNRDQIANKLADLQLTWAEKRITELEAELAKCAWKCDGLFSRIKELEAEVECNSKPPRVVERGGAR